MYMLRSSPPNLILFFIIKMHKFISKSLQVDVQSHKNKKIEIEFKGTNPIQFEEAAHLAKA